MTDNRTDTGQRGAAAVEFALVLPVLLLLIMGLIEFSLIFNSQISLTNAAREGARVMAIHNDPAAATSAAIAAAPSVNDPAIAAGDVTVSPSDCAAGSTVTVTIHYSAKLLTGFFGVTLPLTGKGVMLCGG
ncbi:MAG TPA: pilus assembly protein TadE [Microbacteriaceae bacterium]|jgi:Flp pilus assembly protein TadG|nr:pilus assembly protein TadE [Microbacteriaceae bacterium]